MKKLGTKIGLSLCLAFGALVFFQSLTPPTTIGIREFEQNPPFLNHMYIQKLQETTSDGSNVIVRLAYETDNRMPNTMNLFYGSEGNSTNFHDDGQAPDIEAGDYIYAAYVKENIDAFVSAVTSAETNALAKGGYTHFEGHTGEWISDYVHFDMNAFNNYLQTEINMQIIAAADCGAMLKKENSLFITDLGVVENTVRTYNVLDNTGNTMGAWNFSQLIFNATINQINANLFLKEWVKQFLNQQTINGQVVPGRFDYAHPTDISGVMKYLIEPWIRSAYNNPANFSITTTNWEQLWDAAGNAIVVRAPFKLTAIVNRMDLHGNSSFINPLANTGETRFIYSLIVPFDNTLIGGSNNLGTPGGPITNFDNDFSTNTPDKDDIDWKGMNIILEYQNPPSSRCEMHALAQQWVDLSSFTLGSEGYNNALQQITDAVTAANAAPNRPNGSNLLRIRTNERIFFPSCSASTCSKTWESSDWEMRQFEIDPSTHLLKGVPVANTPVSYANASYNQFFHHGTGGIEKNFDFYAGSTDNYEIATHLIDWVYGNVYVQNKLLKGTHVMPTIFPSTSLPMLAATATLDGEYTHAWDLFWDAFNAQSFSKNNLPTKGDYLNDKKIRQQLSLNTCQGCHSGETKTMFTQIRPLGYGQKADYWSNNFSDYTTIGRADMRFSYNNGNTKDANAPGGSVPNYAPPSNYVSHQYFVNVSAFLTGRNYSGNIGAGTFQDDELYNVADNSKDNQVGDGFYYVNDPTNRFGMMSPAQFPPDPVSSTFGQKWGYNDLEMRKQKLCNLLKTCSISASKVIDLATSAPIQPMPYGSH